MKHRVNVLGVGVTQLSLPGAAPDVVALASEASRLALADAGINHEQVKSAYAGFAGGNLQRGCGVQGMDLIDMPGVSAMTLGCATAAFSLGRQVIESGSADCVLVIGAEALEANAEELDSAFAGRLPALSKAHTLGNEPLAQQILAGAAREYIERHGASTESFASVALKAHRHASRNSQALHAQRITLDDVLDSEALIDPLTRLQSSQHVNGAAAVILCSDAFLSKIGDNRPVRIVAQAIGREPLGATGDSFTWASGHELNAATARQAYEQAGFGPEEIDVCELDDTTSASELLAYEALGFCPEGGAGKFIADGGNTYGGAVVINPSGGALAGGNARGATPLAQCAELVRQLRGSAGERQVEGARTALQQCIGLSGASLVTIYQCD
ncbi:thiolase C-terminal domain-containing protein [Pseudomonas schmalbachii]|uniref:Lipid-transfer protein n=1 Tax=Pseudomonas schmalbachii TaxID=2816993 RepID=A0ABS3TKW4_9PSED|nr:lipid-transfer protein [Pseudomonas schmalbachii]MBO3274043.1 lipid-transfer protein [Pseudomonas schmalbachii]